MVEPDEYGGVLQWLDDNASQWPDAVAIEDHDRSITYREYDQLSNAAALELMQMGVQPGDRVGLAMRKSWACYVGIFAILKTGAAFVPLPAEDPPTRNRSKIDHCGITVLLVDRDGELAKGNLVSELVLYDPASAAPMETGPEIGRPASSLCYICHTSGSTGAPKGVAISDGALAAFIDPMAKFVPMKPGDRVAQTAPLHFDMSIWDVFHSVKAAATLVPAAPGKIRYPFSLFEFLDSKAISHWFVVPTLLGRLVENCVSGSRSLPDLDHVIFGGEAIHTKHASLLAEVFPNAMLHHIYGTTETTVFNTICSAKTFGSEPIPLGVALPGTIVRIMDSQGRLAEAGEIGEMHLGGPQLFDKYWRQPAETKARMVICRQTGARLYRTGDLVEVAGDGQLYFRGRKDNMVKINGFRIELGEVENCLLTLDKISRAAVFAKQDTKRGQYLIAALETTSDAQISPKTVAEFCRDRLPQYMVPRQFVFVEIFPTNSSGKIDHKALEAEFSA